MKFFIGQVYNSRNLSKFVICKDTIVVEYFKDFLKPKTKIDIMTNYRISALLAALLMVTALFAQKKTVLATMFPQNQTATVTLKDGRTLKAPNSNVFLKNASLLYFQASSAKEANMDVIDKVDFKDKHFININNRLAYFVDSIKGNSLYCVEVIDIDAYERNLRNNVNYSFIEFSSSDQLNAYTNDMNTEEDYVYPLIKEFFFSLNGKIIRAHDRDLWVELDKQQYRMLKTIIDTPDFSWTDNESLMKLLKFISK